MHVAQPGAQVLTDLRVQRAEGLVEQQDAGIRRQGTGQRHALPLAAGQLRGVTLLVTGQSDDLEELIDARRDLRFRTLAHAQPEGHVVAYGHVLEGGVVLEDETDTAVLRAEPGDVAVVDDHGAGVGLLQPGYGAQQGGLSGAGRAQQRGQGAFGDGERDIVECGEDRGGAVGLHGVGDGDGHLVTSCFFWRRVMMTSTMTETIISSVAAE